jgi:hypothetical protein
VEVGYSQAFVIAQGFRQEGGRWELIGHDGSVRLFAELSADPDRPEARPGEAYRALLASLQPGWMVRLLQTFWPDPLPRQAFFHHAESWRRAKSWQEGVEQEEGIELLHQGLLLFTQEFPLPFIRRTILEFARPGDEGMAWWEGLPGLLQAYGLRFRPLSPDEIQELARWIFNPELG